MYAKNQLGLHLRLQYGINSRDRMCEPITIPMCQGLSYNQTMVPNLLGHTSQREAVMKMSFFSSIVQTVCSADIQLFLCRVYAPECVDGRVQRPCRSFCEKARRNCEGLMRNFDVSWPNELQCQAFPEESCISVRNKSYNIKTIVLNGRFLYLAFFNLFLFSHRNTTRGR